MSAGIRVPLDQAELIAGEVIAALEPACERIEVAGSIRRGRPDVGDIELVAVSRTHTEPSGLFYDIDATVWDLDDAIVRYAASGAARRLLGKDRYTKLQHRASGIQVDIFTVRPPAQWGVIFLIRTGPADYSHELVTDARRRGFHVAYGALHRGGALSCGSIPCEVVPTPEEADVYRALGLPYVRPGLRS